MSIVVTVMNMKGGVGKTTVAMHLGGMLGTYEMKKKRRKVLIIDYDPQFNLSQAFIPSSIYFKQYEDKNKTSLSILQDSSVDPLKLQTINNQVPPKAEDLVYNVKTKDGSVLDIVPSTLDLMYIALGRPDTKIDYMEERFNKFIKASRKIYDVIIIDCHPAGSIFTKTSLTNSDHVIIPVSAQPYAVRGIGLMREFIQESKRPGQSAKEHILFNAVPRSEVTKEEMAIRGNPRFTDSCFKNTLKKYLIFSQPMNGSGFVWQRLGRKPYKRQAFMNLWSVTEEFIDRVGA